MRKSTCAILTLALTGIGVAPTLPVLAQEASGNWMKEYVQLRVNSKNLQVVTGRALGAAGIDSRLIFTPRIVGGTDAGAADNPFQVGLLNRTVTDNAAAQFCGGSLIRANVVVTAAHCSDFITANQVQVLTGTRRLDGTGTRRDVVSIAIHPSWNSSTFDNDVAVWRLATSATGIPLATLATEDGPVGGNLLATGWGALSQGGGFPIDLQRVEVPLVTRTNCNDANSYNGAITDSMLCAGLDAGGRDSCQGDSGGPLTRGADNGVLTGITSWGIGCAQANFFGVYTRVSRNEIRGFIENTLRSLGSDFNGDGRSDVAFHKPIPGSTWNTLPVLLSDGDGTWTAHNTAAPTWAHQAGAIAISGD